MQLYERILTRCSSGSPVKSLIPAVLGVRDHQLSVSNLPASQHSSPCTATAIEAMAHSASMLLSPTKRPFSSSATSSSPARTALVMSPSSATKRPLAALQCCPSSGNILSALAPQHQHALHSAAGGENEQPGPIHAAKRLEVVQGLSSASKPRQPVTPLISQPEPLAGQQTSAQLTPTAAPTHPATADSGLHAAAAAAASAAVAAAATSSAGAGVLPRNNDLRMFSDQLPSPCTILEVPPALMAASSAAAAAAAATGPLQDSHADVEQLLQHAHRGPQHVPTHIMSGKKLDKRYDIPVNIGFLDEYSDHQPALGSGKLDVIMGPMFAGKTTALLKRLSKVVAGRPFICVKSSKDTRYSDHWIMTHGGGCVRCLPFHSLAEFKAHMSFRWHKIQVIAIDEAQFFPDLIEFCQEAVDNDGKHVIVAGLSGDFRRRRFGQVLDLMPLADSVQQLKSICSVCGGKHGQGLFSLRKVQSGPQEVVGGDEAYMATCRRCYLEHGGQLQ